jgi:hypothetical protein
MGDILVGTASWADKSLVDSKLFYPKEAKTSEARLRHYATNFRLVEMTAPTMPCLRRPLLRSGLSARLRRSSSTSKHFGSSPNTRPPEVLPPDIREAPGIAGREEECLLR